MYTVLLYRTVYLIINSLPIHLREFILNVQRTLMGQKMKKKLVLLISVTLSGAAYANFGEGPFEEQGFSGQISLLAGFGGSESNFNTDNATKTESDLNTSGKSESDFMMAPLGQLNYTFGNQKVFMGTSRSDIVEGVFAFEFGYAFAVGQESALSFSFLPTIVEGETWQDPYLLNTARKKTDVSGNAYRVQYENILNTGVDADFAYFDKDIEDELSGSTLSSSKELLKRSGTGYYFSMSTGIPISQSTFIMPSIEYQQFDADGKAMSYDKYGLGLTLMHMIGHHRISLNGDYSKADYDAENPMFNKTQEDSSYGVNLAYEYSNFMGWNNVGFNVLAGYGTTDSNIDFYDEKDYMLGLGVSYLF